MGPKKIDAQSSWRLVSLRRCIYRHMAATFKSKLTGRPTDRPTDRHTSLSSGRRTMEVAVWGERDAAHNSSGKHSEEPKEREREREAITASGPD